jgi:tetratricopeptide (TPR) repeat protein
LKRHERRYDDAVVLLESALEADPDATEVHYPLAQAYRALGDSEQARQHLDRFQLRAPVIRDPLLEELQAATQRALPAFKRGIHAVRAGDYKTAVDELASGLEVDPDNAAARVSYARVLYLAGRRDAAAEELERALAVAPDQPLSHFLRGVLRQERGDQAGAVAAYRRALDLDPRHPGALFHLANLRLQAADFAGAAPLYEQVLAEDASVAPARVLALVAALRSGTPEAEILERLQALVAAHPEDLQQRYALARLLAAAQDTGLRDPQRALHIAAELAVESPMPAHQGLLALAQAAAGRFEEAVKTQRQLVSLAAWMAPPQELERLERELEAYESGRIPGPAWPADDPLLAPPPFDATRAFRDYPAVKPY